MHVALVTHNVIKGDGQGRVNYEIARHLSRHGVQVTLVADKVSEDLLQQGISWHRVPLPSISRPVNLVKVWAFKREANRIIDARRHELDAIIACGAVLDRPHTLNAVHFVHGTWLRSPYHTSKLKTGPYAWYQWAYTKLNAQWELNAFRAADRVVAVSTMVEDELCSIGVASECIDVIVNGVDVEEFAPGPADREALGLPSGVVLGFFAGDLQSPIKNLDAVLHAMVEVPEVHLAIAGGLERSPYPALAKQLDIEHRTHFLGFRRDIPDLMRAADFFTLPSRRDSCPLVHLEAMASGLPSIVSNMVGTANLVDGSGFVMDAPDDVDALIGGMRVFVSDPDRRQHMGRLAREKAQTLSWSRMAERYLHLLERT